MQKINVMPAWIRFIINQLIVPIGHKLNQHILELQDYNKELTDRVYKLEQRWQQFAVALQPPNVVEPKEVGLALVKLADAIKPRPDPLTNPDPTERTGA